MSDVGIVGFLGALAYWAYSAGSVWPVIALYVGPYMFTNAWLVLYTWLQHTDVDVPHFGPESWTWEKGAFMTIDRPYGPLFDFLHHRCAPLDLIGMPAECGLAACLLTVLAVKRYSEHCDIVFVHGLL